MFVWELPSYSKPRIKVYSWTIPMVYEEREQIEFIADNLNIHIAFKGTIPAYRNYRKLVLRTDLKGEASSYKINVDVDSKVVLSIDELISKATGNKVFAKFTKDVNLLDPKATQFIEEIYYSLDENFRMSSSPPNQWLVLLRNKQELTRLCWVNHIKGNVEVAPFGIRNILLIVDDGVREGNSRLSVRAIKAHRLAKERLDERWRTLQISEEVEEVKEEFSLEGFKKEEEEVEKKVGEVE